VSNINEIIHGNTFNVLKTLPDESVNCVVTSPPYWGLRDYGIEPVIWDGDKDCKHEWFINTTKISGGGYSDKSTLQGFSNKNTKGRQMDRDIDNNIDNAFCLKCNAWRGSLGLEPTFELYIKHLCDIFDEVKRVLRKDGTCWVNLGDTYWGGGNNRGSSPENLSAKQFSNRGARGQVQNKWTKDYQAKSLCLIPQRFAIEMVNRGWILRNTIIWHKPNCMPSSAKDRFTVDFEYVYFFVKSKKYCFEQQFEAWTDTNPYDTKRAGKYIQYGGKHKGSKDNKGVVVGDPVKGRNKRAVWTIPTKPFPEAHFAVYPEKLIEPMIKAGCPRYVCKKCGKARVKIYEKGRLISSSPDIPMVKKPRSEPQNKLIKQDLPKDPYGSLPKRELKEIGYTDCGCNAGFEGGIVLDPFMGAGTTAVVAKKLGRNYLGIEIKQEYIDIANKRIKVIPELLF